MELVIRAHTIKDETRSRPLTVRFDERGGTIGRSDTNTLALPDPERHISRLQAEVRFADGCFALRNVGSANAILVNGRPIGPGESAALVDGDELVIGGYALRAAIGVPQVAPDSGEERAAVDARSVIKASIGESRTNPRLRAAAGGGAQALAPAASSAPPVVPDVAASGGGASSNPFADLLGAAAPLDGGNPFSDLLGPARPAPIVPTVPAMRSAPTPATAVAMSPATAAPALPVTRLPDNFDPFADASAVQDTRPGLPVDLAFDDLVDPGASGRGASIDELFDLSGPPPGQDPLAGFMTAPPPAGHVGGPLDLLGERSELQTTLPAAFDHTPALRGAYAPPAVMPERPSAPATRSAAPAGQADAAPRPTPAAPPASTPSTVAAAALPALDTTRVAVAAAAPASPCATEAADALWAAFCDGAGVTVDRPQGVDSALMRELGQMVFHAVDGALRLLAARAAVKQELRAEVTIIQSRNNNPLKFSPDTAAALEQLLRPPLRGFMSGPAALDDAMQDLLGHAVGTMAGMRAALGGVLQRFEPQQLEGKLASSRLVDAMLPMNRRARLWEQYLQHYARIRDEAQDDFHELFGKAFVQAYEEQFRQLAAAPRRV